MTQAKRKVYAPTMEERAPPRSNDDESRRGGSDRTGLYAFLITLGLVGAVALWFAANRGPEEIPVVTASTKPFKEAEPLPPGAGPPDRAVYDVIEGAKTAETVTPMPGPERPLSLSDLEANPPVAPPPTAKPAAAPKAENAKPPPVAKPAPAAPAKPVQAGIGGAFAVQLAALQAPEGARVLFDRLKAQAPAAFHGRSLDVQTTSGAVGDVHRVRVGFFPDRESAQEFCTTMKSLKQDCFVVVR